MAESEADGKRPHSPKEDDAGEESGDEGWIGPMPSEAAKPKKRKVLEYEQVYLDSLPSASAYEKSYMHRDVVTHVRISKTDFIITASVDGHVKFWKKMAEGIEFVKHFRSHLGTIHDVALSSSGRLYCTVASDETMKVFDVVNFDMINMMKLGFVPGRVEWIHATGDAVHAVAVSERACGTIRVYDGAGDSEPMRTLDRLHKKEVACMRYNAVCGVAVSADLSGMVEYWCGARGEYAFPKCVRFDSKLDTDLYEFAKARTHPTNFAFSPDGELLASTAMDRKVRLFRFATGKLYRVFDESLKQYTELQQTKQQLPNMEFGRRMAIERELDKTGALAAANVVFDESGNFVLYSTLTGVKLVNVRTNRCVRELGKLENARFVDVALFQGAADRPKTALTVEMEASENPALAGVRGDPTLVCTAYRKNRFYLFTRREPGDARGGADAERDVFNEKPSKEDVVAATESKQQQRLYGSCVIHSSLGDIHCRLFAAECPRSIENFCVHSKNGYYNGHLFHRIIKGFMVQTGDPKGDGTGGESIWGGEFEDEFNAGLRHDRPYTLSMANAGANTNGSQFFISVVPCPWLDNKHTVFGRVTKGMEVVQNISNVKTNPKTDKPYEDVSIVSITLKN
ncbi:PREDICTED: peptidylprolyl isomerase domain and WD repeat-containing protein 1-like [Priapulus caudatus]|uniref:peptidylprolyl isomerase n=1 Tax=Priapulus caudatus TaxID=37621 RepID=A0ABM1DU93_PRICU|nr:PREDICTED: peptidylprolyl isomerase domain and WD repeat-containing protein 1-like [Priapulus caudatus]